MKIIEDKANKEKKHVLKNQYFQSQGIEVERLPLPVGDYIILNDKVEDVLERKAKRGIEVKKMDLLGTYSVVVDTKENLQEVVNNICGKSHARFRDECILAQNNGIKLYILIENTDGVNSVQDVFWWVNPRYRNWCRIKSLKEQGKALNTKLSKTPPTKGEQLAKAMLTMQHKYGCEFVFCHPKDAGKKVVELLTGECDA